MCLLLTAVMARHAAQLFGLTLNRWVQVKPQSQLERKLENRVGTENAVRI
jgi:hypothetical protein